MQKAATSPPAAPHPHFPSSVPNTQLHCWSKSSQVFRTAAGPNSACMRRYCSETNCQGLSVNTLEASHTTPQNFRHSEKRSSSSRKEKSLGAFLPRGTTYPSLHTVPSLTGAKNSIWTVGMQPQRPGVCSSAVLRHSSWVSSCPQALQSLGPSQVHQDCKGGQQKEGRLWWPS